MPTAHVGFLCGLRLTKAVVSTVILDEAFVILNPFTG